MLSGVLLIAACSSPAPPSAGPAVSPTAAPAPQAPRSSGAPTRPGLGDRPLRIVVTNDDGVRAPGIDRMARALRALPGTSVTVVAPARDRSGTGSTRTRGPVASTPARTASGLRAVAVRGYPADVVRMAVDRLRLDPDLVVSGVNRGLNTGRSVRVSGTIGAARAALARGIPAVAASAQRAPDASGPHYRVAVRTVVRWVERHRAALLAGTPSIRTLLSVNSPTCRSGQSRGTAKVRTARGPRGTGPSDCSSTLPRPRTDVVAVERGFVALTRVGR